MGALTLEFLRGLGVECATPPPATDVNSKHNVNSRHYDKFAKLGEAGGLDAEVELELEFNVRIVDGREVWVILPATALVMELASVVGTELKLASDSFVQLFLADKVVDLFSSAAALPQELAGI